MTKVAFVILILLSAFADGQTNSPQACDATLSSYRVEFDALKHSPESPTPTTSEFSLVHLFAIHNDVAECEKQQRAARRPFSADLKSVSDSVNAMLAKRLVNYFAKHPEHWQEIDASTPGVLPSQK
jgi:hypothetical protein